MPVKVVSVNDEVQARRPNTCQWRAARVLEDANQSHNHFVKLKFIGDTTIHTIPWAHIKLFQFAKCNSFFRNSVPSRSLTTPSRKVISIDLTDSEDLEDAQIEQSVSIEVNARSLQTEQEKDRVGCDSPAKHPSSVAANHQTRPNSSPLKALNVNTCGISNSDLNGHLVLSDQDTTVPDAAPSDEADTPQTSKESVSARVVSNSEVHDVSLDGNRLESPSKHVSGLNSVRRLTRSFAFQTEPVQTKKIGNKDIIWDTRPASWEDELRKDLERTTTLNGNSESSLQNVAGERTVSIPRERHPQRAVEDVPVPRAIPQYNDSFSLSDLDSGMNEDMFSRSVGLTPSKRPRSSNDFVYKSTMVTANLNKLSSDGFRGRMRKKARRLRESHEHSANGTQCSTERLREVISNSGMNILERFKSKARFPFASEDEDADGHVDKLVINKCDDIVDEHKSEVQAMLQSFGELKIKRTQLTVRSRGSRKKSRPQRWADRKITEGTVFQQGQNDPATKNDMGAVEDIPSGLFNTTLQDGGFVDHELRCGCQSHKSSDRNGLSGRAALQCGLCGYWSHLECVALDENSIADLRGTNPDTKKHFVCTFCVDDATNRSLVRVKAHAQKKTPQLQKSKSPALANARARSDSGEAVEWHSHVSPVILPRHQTMKHNSRSLRKSSSRPIIATSRNRYRPRPPLSEAEIQARNENVEFLRSGVLKPSVGFKERELIDGKTPNFSL
eukprot:TRINITY_DN237_c0_g1_i1.p1 TRINITY_DN237_c0_g1~~TRINITY_DN237_c0_g1_i1.p1  ORF type:complete len:728 (-),score=91.25 TRINITY_DN237_c0_g1_i1:1666-3849(-)